jgi:hypothetical protein
MKHFTRTLIIMAVVLGTAATTRSQGAATDPGFVSFWKTFKTAIARNDKEAVADVTKLPFLYDSKERDRAGFIRIYPSLFTPRIRKCIATAKLVKEQENYDVFCGQLIFYFGKDSDGKYKLLEFGVND